MVRKVVKTIPASVFKANCPAILQEIFHDRIEVIITKRGRPVAKLIPPRTPRKRRAPAAAPPEAGVAAAGPGTP